MTETVPVTGNKLPGILDYPGRPKQTNSGEIC
jgi:hypothetical protein